jgi:hypothetical protein
MSISKWPSNVSCPAPAAPTDGRRRERGIRLDAHEGHYATLECLTVPSSGPSADGSVSTEPFRNRSAAEPGPRGPFAPSDAEEGCPAGGRTL